MRFVKMVWLRDYVFIWRIFFSAMLERYVIPLGTLDGRIKSLWKFIIIPFTTSVLWIFSLKVDFPMYFFRTLTTLFQYGIFFCTFLTTAVVQLYPIVIVCTDVRCIIFYSTREPIRVLYWNFRSPCVTKRVRISVISYVSLICAWY